MSEVRSVNGYGPRCGCGGKSVLHYRFGSGRKITPAVSVFLCLPCAGEAFESFLIAHPKQPPYWPGDEDRDEPYVFPDRASNPTQGEEG